MCGDSSVRNNLPICVKIILGFCLAACLPITATADDASATPTENGLYDECSEFSMAGIHDCLQKKRDESQKVLAQAEARMNTVMSRWDVDDQFIVAAKSNFIKDKQEFLKYREVHCNFMRSLGGPVIGMGLDTRLYTCVAELNYRRAKLLEDVFPDLPSK